MLTSVWRHWYEGQVKLWATPHAATTVALFRILVGWVGCLQFLILAPNAASFFGGQAALVRPSTAFSIPLETYPKLTLLALFDSSPLADQAAIFLIWLYGLAAFSLMVGFRSKLSNLICAIILISIHSRNPFVLHGGDFLMHEYLLFLLLANSGGKLSVDAWLARKSGKKHNQETLPVAENLVRFQLIVLYYQAFLVKCVHEEWTSGVAVYYVTRLDDFGRFSLPEFFYSMEMSKTLCAFTMALEFALFTLVFIKPLRYWVLLAGALFHIGLDIMLNIPYFQLAVLAGYVCWVAPSDTERALYWLQDCARRFAQRMSIRTR
jgi:hypothetical protein